MKLYLHMHPAYRGSHVRFSVFQSKAGLANHASGATGTLEDQGLSAAGVSAVALAFSMSAALLVASVSAANVSPLDSSLSSLSSSASGSGALMSSRNSCTST